MTERRNKEGKRGSSIFHSVNVISFSSYNMLNRDLVIKNIGQTQRRSVNLSSLASFLVVINHHQPLILMSSFIHLYVSIFSAYLQV
jgi:hypothetical protein